VGNLERYQGIDLLLQGFRVTLRRVPSASLVIVGGREDDIRRYSGIAGGLGIQSRVHFLGPRPVHELSALLKQADVLVSPRLKGLNTPMKIYSYLDSGTALGTGLASLLGDGALRERLGRRAKAYVQDEFTPEAARRKLASFYDAMEAKVAGVQA
jgi:glycosyltransferase involved in cell wall biosynthesis